MHNENSTLAQWIQGWFVFIKSVDYDHLDMDLKINFYEMESGKKLILCNFKNHNVISTVWD